MVTVILELAKSLLSIVDIKIRRKYIDQLLELERLYYAEINKTDGVRSNAVLDNIEHELRVIGSAIAADSRAA